MARETINGISVPIPGTGEPADFVGDLRQIATDLPASQAAFFRFLGWVQAPAPSGSDQRAALQALLDDADTRVLLLRPGQYVVGQVEHPVTAGYYNALTLGTGQSIVGPGRDLCTIKLADNAPMGIVDGGTAIIYNRTLTGGDENPSISGVTIDGNAANQTKTMNGIVFIRTRGATCTDVRVKNVRGTANVPPHETFHFDTQLGIDSHFTRCEAVGEQSGTETASGFSANNCTNVTYDACVARGMKYGHGFTHYQTRNLSHSNCFAYLNGDIGFNSEESVGVTYTGCHAGGDTAPISNYPYAAATDLGNTIGFVINGTKGAHLVACTSRGNTNNGLTITPGSGGSGGTVTDCSFTDSPFAVSATAMTDMSPWRISPIYFSGITTAIYDLHADLGGYQTGPGYALNAPAVPASADFTYNKFPFPVVVYLVGGSITLLRVNDADIETSTKTVTLLPGQSIRIFYSSAPTWLWFGQ